MTLIINIFVFLGIGYAASRVLAAYIEKKYPAIGQFINIDYQGESVRLHYLDSSVNDDLSNEKKPTLILIHGATGNLHDLKSSIYPQLSERYRVILFDRPGLGFSERPRHGDSQHWCSPKQQMLIIRSAIQVLNIQKPFLVGHSLAGPIVLDYMMQFGNELSGSILLSPVSHPWPNGVTWYNYLDRLPIIKELLAYSWLPVLGYFSVSSGLKILFFPETVPKNYRDKTALDLFFRSRVMLDNFRDLRLLCEYVAVAGRGYRSINTPVQIITGTDDKVIASWLHSEKLSYELSNVDWINLPNLGHSPHHSRTEKVVDIIDQFIARQLY